GRGLSWLPVTTRLGLGAKLARVAAMCAPRRREVALRNLRIAFPDWSEAKRVQTFEESCRHLGRGMV
ncbi:MAG: lipid A biosynthesis acyltransferase, partial [Akkermansiaceae bacterium]|nr:lipid A biosynthesis acyltransferase [Akkermansiaceae bacterium]